jgi:hypothetical protein
MSQESSIETVLQESIVKPLQGFVLQLQRALGDPAGGELLLTLQHNYSEEQRLLQQLRAHAAAMPNALFHDAYAHVIAETEQHAHRLAAQIQRHDSPIPPVDHHTPAPTPTTTIWRLIAADIAAIGALSSQYHAQLGRIADPQVQQLLNHIRKQQQQQRRGLTDLLARIDSYARPEITDEVNA